EILARGFLELLCVRRRQKGALVMVEPPCDFWRIGILEIDNHVLVAVKKARFPRLLRFVRHSRKAKLAIRVKFFTVKAVKQRSRCSSVKAAVVKAEPDSGHIRGKRAFPAVRSTPPPATKLLTMRCPSEKVKTQLGQRKSHFTRESGSAFPKFKC